MANKTARVRRALRTRATIKQRGIHRLSVHRTPKHMYAQVISPQGSEVVVSASTLQGAVKEQLKGPGGNVDAAKLVGKIIAERAKAAGVTSVAFDRAGFTYHGRVKALADAAREAGLNF